MSLYEYRTTQTLNPPGVDVRLVSLETQKVQPFFFAGAGRDVNRINEHMDTLTDDQCDFWLNPERLKAKQELEREKLKAERSERAKAQALAVEAAKAEKARLKQLQKDKQKKS